MLFPFVKLNHHYFEPTLKTIFNDKNIRNFYNRYYNAADQLINRISAALQYFLDNITTNQSLLFEVIYKLSII